MQNLTSSDLRETLLKRAVQGREGAENIQKAQKR